MGIIVRFRSEGNSMYIVEKEKEFWLVNLEIRSKCKARPPEYPDMFLKFGYYEGCEKVTDEIMKEIVDVMDNGVLIKVNWHDE